MNNERIENINLTTYITLGASNPIKIKNRKKNDLKKIYIMGYKDSADLIYRELIYNFRYIEINNVYDIHQIIKNICNKVMIESDNNFEKYIYRK
jgi:CTP:phosphocholine cytidylyltransferase-like protein